MCDKLRVQFFVDGFNLYHELDKMNANHLKWFNLRTLLGFFIDEKIHKIDKIYYFTAPTKWNALKLQRQGQLLQAFRILGINVINGRFQLKEIRSNRCVNNCSTYEEKETDVNIALRMYRAAIFDEFDVGILVSNDSDQSPTLNLIKKDAPTKILKIITPPNTTQSEELKKIVGKSNMPQLKRIHFERSLMPETLKSPHGHPDAKRPQEYNPPTFQT